MEKEAEIVEKKAKMNFEQTSWDKHQRSVSEISAWEEVLDEPKVFWKKACDRAVENSWKKDYQKRRFFDAGIVKVEKNLKVALQVLKLPEIKGGNLGFKKENHEDVFIRGRRKSNEGIVRINEFSGRSIKIARSLKIDTFINQENLRVISSLKRNKLRMY